MIRKLGLLLLLITVLLWEAPARGEAPASTRSADFDVRPAESRGFEQEGDTLQLGEATGTLVSEVFSPGWEFIALGVTWQSELPAGAEAMLEVRASSDGEHWGDWMLLEIMGEDRPDDVAVTSSELLFITGTHAQLRAALHNRTGDAVAWEGLQLTLIDSRPGPTAETRTTAACPSGAPNVVCRAQWGADESYRQDYNVFHPVRAFFVHHTVTDADTDPYVAVRAVYYYHAVTQGWGDIGYHYLISQDGRIFEGRYNSEQDGLLRQGAHVYGYNQGTMGVSLLGNFESNSSNPPPSYPAAAMLNSLTELLARRAILYGINPLAQAYVNDYRFSYGIVAHQDSPLATTNCPGSRVYLRMGEIRSRVVARIAEINQPPPPPPLQVQLTSPAVDSVVDGLFTLQARPASTGPSVRRVEYYLVSNGLNGSPTPSFIGASDGPPWNIVVDSHALPAGRYTLRAIAKADGGASATDERTFNVATWNWTNPNPVPGSRRLYIPLMQTTRNPACRPLIKNGEFRSNTDWLTLLGTNAAWYDDARSVSPPHSLRVGMSYWENSWSYSSAWLPLTIPSDAARATLTLKYLPEAGDLSEGNSEGGDHQYIQVRDSSEPTSAPLAQVLPYGLQNATQWQTLTYDLSTYRGRSIYLYVGAFNNGTGSSTRLYVDDVQVTACRN
ncbi:MAG TPA: N-acetylmuramoyl-L-alanine amidase [Ardenticatenaceae bacterium]|jgi:hypothetical protein